MTIDDMIDHLSLEFPVTGCTLDEVARIEKTYSLLFPTDYKKFLLFLGNHAGELWKGSDYTCEELPSMQETAMELLGDAGLELPKDAFVFLMHQGYQFYYLSPNGVFYYHEGRGFVEKRYSSFGEMFEKSVSVLLERQKKR